MLCNKCGKNKATIHITELVNDQMLEIHLCEKCSQEQEGKAKVVFPFDELFAGMMQFTAQAQEMEKQMSIRCSGCQMSLHDLQKKGKVGCAVCYQTFAQFLMPLIQKVQGTTQHFGKKPLLVDEKLNVQIEIRKLEEELQLQIQNEHFEEAAITRDKVKFLRRRLEGMDATKKNKTKKKTSATKKRNKKADDEH